MRKKLAFILIITILINTIIPRAIYATDVNKAINNLGGNTTQKEIGDHSQESGQKTTDQVFEDQKATVTPSNGGSRTESVSETASSSSVVASALSGFFAVFPKLANFFMTSIVKMFQESVDGNVEGNFTIEGLVLNKYTLFKINYFDVPENLGDENTAGALKRNVAAWYISLRNIALVANLIILIYIGIRMVISTVATDKAKYKKMLINWLISCILIFTLHYIVIGLLVIQDWIIDIISSYTAGEGFEEKLINDTWNSIGSAKGWDSVPLVILIYVLVYYQAKFFLMYMKRLLTVGFLLVISPLITITYAIDAVKDGKSQVFHTWLREIVFNIFIQVIHAIVYVIFIISAAEIAKAVPIMGALFFMTLSRAEKIVKSTFKLSSSITKEESLMEKIKHMGHHH